MKPRRSTICQGRAYVPYDRAQRLNRPIRLGKRRQEADRFQQGRWRSAYVGLYYRAVDFKCLSSVCPLPIRFKQVVLSKRTIAAGGDARSPAAAPTTPKGTVMVTSPFVTNLRCLRCGCSYPADSWLYGKALLRMGENFGFLFRYSKPTEPARATRLRSFNRSPHKPRHAWSPSQEAGS